MFLADFLGHTVSFWGVVAAIAYDLLTLGLLFVGYRTLARLGTQLREEREARREDAVAAVSRAATQERHHNDQILALQKSREAQLRPVLVVDKAHHDPRLRSGTVMVRNVGSGPAVNVKIEVWIDNEPHREPDVDAMSAALRARMATEPRDGGAGSHGLGPGLSVRVPWLNPPLDLDHGYAKLIDDAAIRAPLPIVVPIIVRFTYNDVFGNAFPETEAKWQLGFSQRRSRS